MQHKAIIIAGPTASGKTSLAIEIAEHFNTQIISADSRQCFRELTIGTAKPSPHELERVKHYFINSHSIKEKVDAAIFERLSLEYAERIFANNNLAIVCGGTGLYIKAFCEGMNQMPDIKTEIRKEVRDNYKEKGLEWLQAELRQKDLLFYEKADINNPRRMMRALEVVEATGKSILYFQQQKATNRDFDIIKIGLSLPKAILLERINVRVEQMMEEGLVEEVKALMSYRHLNALQTVGYKEIFTYLKGKMAKAEAAEKIKINTRQYAKRQMTWFRREKDIHWFDPRDKEAIMEFLDSILRASSR